MTFKSLFGQITILSLNLVNFRVSRFHVLHLTHETSKLCLQNTLNMSKTTRVYFGALQSVYEFRLNNVEIQEIKAAGSSGTGTIWTDTSTNPILVSGTGTTLVGTGTIFPLHRWYRYHPCLVPVPVVGTNQKWQILPFLPHFSFLNFLNSILHQKPPWNPSKTTPQTLIMVV